MKPWASPAIRPAALLLGALVLLGASVAQAQNKCRQPDGSVSFQQTPCVAPAVPVPLELHVSPAEPPSENERNRQARLLNEAELRGRIRIGLETGQAVVGMSRVELEQALGQPLRTDTLEHRGGVREQLRFRRGDRWQTVWLENGRVSAVETSLKPLAAAQAAASAVTPSVRPHCASAREIRDLEIEQSKYLNRDNAALQADLAKRLAAARACR